MTESDREFVGRPLGSFFVSISQIPPPLAISQVSERLVAPAAAPLQRLTPALQSLAQRRIRFVPTQLHVFKEATETKFGFVRYVAAELPPEPPADESQTSGDSTNVELDMLERALEEWLCSKSPEHDVQLQARYVRQDEIAALDATLLVPRSSDPLKALCLAASHLERHRDAGHQLLRLELARFTDSEIALVAAMHGGIHISRLEPHSFMQLQGSSGICFKA